MKAFFLILLAALSSTISRASDDYEIRASHPRIVLTKEGELSLRFLLLENEGAQRIHSALKKEAEQLVNEKTAEAPKSEISGPFSESVLKKVSTLTMAYRLFEENKYADKSIEILMGVCRMESWVSDNPIVMANLTTAAALGYDWMYYYLSREVREVVRNAVVRKGLNPGLQLMENTDNPENALQQNPQHSLVFSASMAIGALSIADFFPDLKSKILYRTLVNSKEKFENMNFDDLLAHNDWDKNVNFIAMMLSSFKASLGHDFNISSIPAMKKFASDYFSYLKISGKEASAKRIDPAILYFGKFNNNHEVPEYYVSTVNEVLNDGVPASGINYICLPWLLE